MTPDQPQEKKKQLREMRCNTISDIAEIIDRIKKQHEGDMWREWDDHMNESFGELLKALRWLMGCISSFECRIERLEAKKE